MRNSRMTAAHQNSVDETMPRRIDLTRHSGSRRPEPEIQQARDGVCGGIFLLTGCQHFFAACRRAAPE